MAKGNFEACAIVTLAYEGGYTNDRRDPGNWTGGKVGKGVLKGTNMGIAANTYPDLDIKSLTRADVLPLYKARYWDGINGDALPYGVDMAVYDYGVNSGPSRGAKTLQSVVGAKADGKVGADTIRKVASGDGKAIIQAVCARRLAFMRGLAVWNTFKRGWSARVANVEAKSVAMWLKGKGAGAAVISATLKQEADKAGKVASGQTKASGATAGVGGVTGGGVTGGVMATGEPNWLMIAGLVILVVAAGVLALKARQNNERAKAYLDVASA